MARPTETERRKAKVEDDDPAAPLFDAVDRMHRRLDAVVSNLRGTASTAAQEVVVPELRRSLLRGYLAMNVLVAIAATAIAFTIVGGMIRSAETRAFIRADALEEERSRSFGVRVEKLATELSASRIREADARASKAEAEAANARATVLAVVGKGGDEDVKALLSALVAAPRGDQNLIWRLLRNPDPNVRRLAFKATEMLSGEVLRILVNIERGGR